jgi:hypothetical protein
MVTGSIGGGGGGVEGGEEGEGGGGVGEGEEEEELSLQIKIGLRSSERGGDTGSSVTLNVSLCVVVSSLLKCAQSFYVHPVYLFLVAYLTTL